MLNVNFLNNNTGNYCPESIDPRCCVVVFEEFTTLGFCYFNDKYNVHVTQSVSLLSSGLNKEGSIEILFLF